MPAEYGSSEGFDVYWSIAADEPVLKKHEDRYLEILLVAETPRRCHRHGGGVEVIKFESGTVCGYERRRANNGWAFSALAGGTVAVKTGLGIKPPTLFG